MDPASAIGTASAVLGFAKITVEGVKLVIELVSRMQEPPNYIKDTLEALELLQNIQQDIQASTVTQGEEAGQNIIKACERCSGCVKGILDTLQKIDRSSRDGMTAKFKTAFNSMRHEKHINGQLRGLANNKQDLTLALVSPSVVAGTMRATINPALKEVFSADAFPQRANAAASAIPSSQSGVDMFLRELRVEKPQDIRQRLVRAKGDRVDGTCSWVLGHEAYQSWLAGTEQGLWINGDAGKGKTMLSIFLTQELERHTAETNGVLLYFFCDSQVSKLSSQLGFIQSLIHQLCLARPSLASHCLVEYQQHGHIAAKSVETLWRCARTMLENLEEGPVFILIDGLDECDANSSVEICQELASLHTLPPGGQQKVRPIIISRPLGDKCKRRLAKFRMLHLNGTNENGGRDISTFIHSKVHKVASDKNYSDALHKTVLATVVQKSEGTFLWAGFVLSDLEETETVDVEDCLASLPPRLDDIYGRILQNIPEDKTAVVEKILKWVVLAVRPLTVSEIAAAISPGPGKTPLSVELITTRIGMCRHLLSISWDVVKLVHQSVRDYLTSAVRPPTMPPRFYLNAQQVHSEITQLCISKMANRLQTAEFSDVFNTYWVGGPTIRQDLEPILGYSIEYWRQHARVSDGFNPIHDNIVSTFLKSEACQKWVHFCHEIDLIPCPLNVLLESEVHLASFLGLKGIVSASISKRRFDVKQRLLLKHPGSHLACTGLLGGHTAIVEILIKKWGASVGKVPDRSSFFSSPIHIAAATNNVQALKLLLDERKNSVNRTDDDGWTPLHHAAFMGSVEACQVLLDKGAQVDSPNLVGLTPLFYAAASSQDYSACLMGCEVPHYYIGFRKAFWTVPAVRELEGGHPRKTNAVQVLLDAKANPNPAPGTRSRLTPLHIALFFTRAEEVEALVRAGADFTAKDERGKSALYKVFDDVRNQDAVDKMATILVDAGAKLDAELELERPFMLDAITDHSLFLVKLAIRLGTDLSYVNKYGQSFLHRAVFTGSKEIVEVLLEAGVDINSGYPPLYVAAYRRRWELFQYLLERGAQMKTDKGHAWTLTIFVLTTEYDPSIVKAMVGAGANPNEILESSVSPLMIAVLTRSHEVVVDLIAQGADVNLDVNGTTALEIALSVGNKEILNILLAAGAKTASGISPLGYVSIENLHEMVDFLSRQEGTDPNEETSTGYTPIEMASAIGHEEVVTELIRAGADASMVSSSRVLALSEAASGDHGEVASMLMENAGASTKARSIGNMMILSTESESSEDMLCLYRWEVGV